MELNFTEFKLELYEVIENLTKYPKKPTQDNLPSIIETLDKFLNTQNEQLANEYTVFYKSVKEKINNKESVSLEDKKTYSELASLLPLTLNLMVLNSGLKNDLKNNTNLTRIPAFDTVVNNVTNESQIVTSVKLDSVNENPTLSDTVKDKISHFRDKIKEEISHVNKNQLH